MSDVHRHCLHIDTACGVHSLHMQVIGTSGFCGNRCSAVGCEADGTCGAIDGEVVVVVRGATVRLDQAVCNSRGVAYISTF